jgi:hypothetical protein
VKYKNQLNAKEKRASAGQQSDKAYASALLKVNVPPKHKVAPNNGAGQQAIYFPARAFLFSLLHARNTVCLFAQWGDIKWERIEVEAL